MGVQLDTMKIETVTGFDWDDGNRLKNQDKHGVSMEEAESAFFNRPLLVLPDVRHSADEPRSYGLGRTDDGRLLFIAFTIRGGKIRVISARDMHRKERQVYHDKIAQTRS